MGKFKQEFQKLTCLSNCSYYSIEMTSPLGGQTKHKEFLCVPI